MDDSELLRQFVGGSQDAFTALARRYADLVYSAALRQTRDPERTHDVTQAVFVLLARKAPHLRTDVILSAWLFKAVRLVAREQARADRRRLIRERKAAMMRQEASLPDPSVDEADQWARVTPLLDEGINRLAEKYRVPLLLRFFEGKSFAELAAKLGLTEASARQRVHRAVSKLRSFLTRRGINVTAGVLSSGMSSAVVHSAPQAIVSAAAAAPTIAGGTALLLAHGAAAATAFFRAKAVAIAAACVTLAVGTVTVVTIQLTDPPTRGRVATPVAAVFTAPAPANPPARQTRRVVIPRPTVAPVPPSIVPTGMVLDSNGAPLAGADCMLVTPRRPLWVNQQQWFGGLRLTTTADGTFSFPPQDGDWELVVCHDTGYARLSRAQVLASHTLKLQPWARVEGTLWVNNQPKPDGEVHLSNATLLPIWTGRSVLLDATMKTDAQGHFEFTRVIPGELWVDRQFPEKPGSHSNFVEGFAEAGKMLHLDVGAGGRSIVGKITFEGDPADAPDWKVQRNRGYSARLVNARASTPPQFPQPPAVVVVHVRHARAVESLQTTAAPQSAAAQEGGYLDPSKTVTQSMPHPRRALFERIEARSYDQRHMGKDAGDHVGFLSADTWLKYENVDFGPGANWFSASVTVSDNLAGNTIEVRLRDPRGPILAALTVESTGGWGNFTSQVAPMTPISGVHDIYLTFSGGNSVADLAWFKFTRTPRDASETIAARTYDACYGARDHRSSVGSLDEGHWLRFGGLNFAQPVTTFSAELSVPRDHAGKFIDIRLDSPEGAVIGTLRPRATGGWDSPTPQSTPIRSTSGAHDVYLTFRGGQGVCDLYSVRFAR